MPWNVLVFLQSAKTKGFQAEKLILDLQDCIHQFSVWEEERSFAVSSFCPFPCFQLDFECDPTLKYKLNRLQLELHQEN